MCAYRSYRLGISTTYCWVLSSHLHQFVPNQQGVATGTGQQGHQIQSDGVRYSQVNL